MLLEDIIIVSKAIGATILFVTCAPLIVLVFLGIVVYLSLVNPS